MALTFKAAKQASEFLSQDYASYIQSSLEDYVARGIFTQEQAEAKDLGDLLAGNDGE